MAPAEHDEFHRWLAVDPRHRQALARADASRTEFDWPWHSGMVDQVLTGLEGLARRRRRHRTVATIGSLAALFVVGLGWQAREQFFPAKMEPRSTLLVSQPQRRTLPDGSIVELKDSAQIAIDFDGPERRVTLARGTAHFQVMSNPARAFVVRAGNVAVRAVGTAFSVEHESAEITVMVTEGRIAVDRDPVDTSGQIARAGIEIPAASAGLAAAPLAFVDAGSAILLPIASDPTREPFVRAVPAAELTEKLSWRVPKLEFFSTPLVDVVAQVNRHAENQRSMRLVIRDASLEQIRLSGVLRADKVEALVAMLESDFSVKAVRLGDEAIELRRAPR